MTTPPDERLRTYQSHKLVRAAKILKCQRRQHSAVLELRDSAASGADGEERSFLLEVPLAWLERYIAPAEAGGDHGYYVQYSDGFASWSPSKAFEEGYSLVTAD